MNAKKSTETRWPTEGFMIQWALLRAALRAIQVLGDRPEWTEQKFSSRFDILREVARGWL